jgi:hypothetical protein
MKWTIYNQVNGAGSNYNGAFRDAKDNNMTFFHGWIAF